MAKRSVEQIRSEIEALEAEMAEVAAAERAACLEQMKAWQKVYQFTKRELGHYFSASLRGKRRNA